MITKKNYYEENKNLLLALQSIKKCKKFLVKIKPQKKKIYKKEIKLNLDIILNNEILKTLEKSCLPIISEEKSFKENKFIIKKKNKFWVVDPLDGSHNFYRGIKNASICITLVNNNKPEISVIYDIFNKDLYLAYKNYILKNNKIILNKRKFVKKKNAVLVTGFPHNYDYSKKFINFKSFQKIRMIGCASLSLLGCCLGKYDWYQEKNIMIWDVISGYHFNLINNCRVKKFRINKLIQEVSLGYCI